MKITNMTSPRTGKPVANQYILTTKDGEYFQSYKTVIAWQPFRECNTEHVMFMTCDHENFSCKECCNGHIKLDDGSSGFGWDYSVTTLEYLKKFLRTSDSKKDIQAKIDAGIYKLADLNK